MVLSRSVVLSQIAGFPSFFIAEQYSIAQMHIYIHHIFSTHSRIRRHLGCSPVAAVVSSTAEHGSAGISWDPDFMSFGYRARSGISASHDSSICIFKGSFVLFSIVAVPTYILTNSAQGSLSSTSSRTPVISCRFYNIHSNSCEVISHCS